jgi:UDP-N-acetylmuramate--alanine ligase
VARRFDFRGEHDGITFVDDYAHLPSEIAAVLEAAATSGDGWRRIVAVFQPNRYSRMAILSPEYRDAFDRADLAVITDIYASGEMPRPGVTGKLVVDAILDAHPWQRVAWMPRRAELIAFLAGELGPGDLCISMGCGDVASLPSEVLARVAEQDRIRR